MQPSIATCCHADWPRRRAFTAVELVIVVLVIGVLAAVAMPAFLDSLLFHRVESAARRVKADLELARQTARLTSAPQTVTFSAFNYTLSTAQHLDHTSANYHVDLAAPPYELDFIKVDFDDATSVSFDGYAAPTTGGTVTLGTKGHRCIVTLDATTGEVTITSSHARARSPQALGN